MFNSRLLVQRDHMTTNIPNTFRIPAEGGRGSEELVQVCVYLCVCVCVCRCVREVRRACLWPAGQQRKGVVV